jgi:acyl-CoA thioesterase-2
MGDLAKDTAVEPLGAGRYRATLSNEWEIWGPMGGYIASVALRAAGEESGLPRPASFTCHFLGVAAFAAVDIEVVPLRRGRTASALRTSVTQDGRPILETLTWAVAGELPGLEHDVAVAPDVPGPDGLPDIRELVPRDAPPPFPFWRNFDNRPLDFEEEWPPSTGRPPVWRGWLRFASTPTSADPWIDACRLLVLVDLQSWPSAHRHHAWQQPAMIAPTLDVSVAFHASAADSEWLLVDGYAPVARDGLIGWNGRLWSADRRLVASGAGQMLCRPIAPAG